MFAEFAKGQKGKQTQWGQQPLVCAFSYPTLSGLEKYSTHKANTIQYRYYLTTLVLAHALSSDTLAYERSNAAQHALFSMPLSLILALIQEELRSIPRKDCIVENWLGHIILIR